MRFFTNVELRDMVITVLVLAIVYAFPDIMNFVTVALPIVLISFVLKQFGHKLMARRLNCTTTYKIHPIALVLSFFTLLFKSAFGFVSMVVGYMETVPYKFGRWGIKVVKLTPYDLGIITLAGLAVNLLLAYTFVFFDGPLPRAIVEINAMIVLFNLIPIPPLDGSKIFMWSIWGWVFFSVLAIVALIL
jgi:Zn-dependent protease